MSSSRRRRPRTAQTHSLFLPLPPLFTPFKPNSLSTAKPLHARPLAWACVKPSNTTQSQYVPLHVHSDFSLLDGASQLHSLVQRASELGVPALALTDHGVLYGAIQLVKACVANGVKPIIGNEMYIADHGLALEEQVGEDGKPLKPPKNYHLIVLAKNTVGYRNLVHLTTIAHMHGKVGKGIFARPCINKTLLYKYREGLIVSSACLGGEIPQAILNDDIDAARSVASWYRDVFGDDYYLEIQDHGSEEDRKVNPVMLQLGRELGINVIATNDSHFTNCLDAEAHDTLICIRTGKMLTDENRLHYAGNEYFKSIDEMRQCFVDHLPQEDVDNALVNTMQVADKVDQYDLFDETRIPDFQVPDGFGHSHDKYLRHVAMESLETRLRTRQKAGLADPELENQYFERLEFELDMIAQMGFSSYFLVVWDYIKYARDQGIPVGPGRGSAAGSLAAFALRITDVDPIPFNLLFERFLNPERKSMPDIDTDFSVAGRDKIISYVTERYGTDRVAQIITFNRLTSKAVLKDVARVHNVPYSEADRLAKLIPVVRGKPATLSKMLSEKSPSPDFKKAIEQNSNHQLWIDKAKRIEGTNKTFGIHAAGVVISSSPLPEIVPLSKAKHGETITQYAMEDVESLGLLKMDFLGLKNLTVIETTLSFINEGRRQKGIKEDIDFSVDALPLDDQKTYQLLAEGELDGIFQLDASGGMRSIVRELRPSSLDDISSILALYRPGPLDAGLIPKFIRRKHGVDPVQYDHPILEPILKETYGIMVYQEQIMRIARDLAGYSLGQADILRRAMGKKKTSVMEKERPRFIAGAEERGVSREKAEELFDMMVKFAEYCFNKSHSTAYAYLTYQTAYLKANYPVEYSAALLKSNSNQSDKLIRYLADANASGVRVAPPSVNKSQMSFTVDRSELDQPSVLFGLEAIKTVGESVARALLNEREANGPFKNIVDLIERIDGRVINKRAMGALIEAGSFDKLHSNRKVLLSHLENLLTLRRKIRDKRRRRERKGLSEEEMRIAMEGDLLAWEEAEVQLRVESEASPDFSSLERFSREKATLGFYASGHPLAEYRDLSRLLGCNRVDQIVGEVNPYGGTEDTEQMSGATPDGSEVMVLSCVTDLKRMTTSKGKKMGKWVIEDTTGRVPGVVFPTSYELMQQIFSESEAKSEEDNEGLETDSSVDGDSPESIAQVVEEDARVVVWGKVDRESSGSAQIVVDDVQRIEQVNVIVATAQFAKDRSPSTHLLILRHAAARILEVDLSQSGFKSYIDANGERRRRRWGKSIPLSKKNRIPLILQCLNEHGDVVESLNAGNNLRFSTDSMDLLPLLAKDTGFNVELLSVASDIMMKRNMGVPPVNIETANEQSHSAEEASDMHQVADQSLSTSIEEESSAPSRTYMPDATDVHESAEDDDNRANAVALMNAIFPGTRREDESEIEDTKSSDTYKPEKKSFDRIDPSRRDASLFFSTAMGRQLYKNSGKISFSKTIKENVIALQSLKSTETSKLVTLEKTGSSSSSAEYSSSILTKSEENSTTCEDVTKRAVESSGSSSSAHELGIIFGKNDSPKARSLAPSKIGQERTNLPPALTPTASNNSSLTYPGEDIPSIDTATSATILNENSAPTVRNPNEISSQESNRAVGSYNISFDKSGIAGVLDAAAFVASESAFEHTQSRTFICGMSGIEMTKLVEEEVKLLIRAHTVYTKGNFVYVTVAVKETEPSGKRKRVRSFGPVICVLQVKEDTKEIPIRSKRARKEIESMRQKLIKAGDETAIDVRVNDATESSKRKRRKRVARGADADFEISATNECEFLQSNMSDGGAILAAMSRSAGLCLDKGLGLVQACRVDSLDGFVVENPNALFTANALKMRVHLEGLCFGTSKVQVEAIVTDEDGAVARCRGSFRVSAAEHMGQSALSVLASSEQLFDGSLLKAWFNEACQKLPE